jgi:hypothetical protein
MFTKRDLVPGLLIGLLLYSAWGCVVSPLEQAFQDAPAGDPNRAVVNRDANDNAADDRGASADDAGARDDDPTSAPRDAGADAPAGGGFPADDPTSAPAPGGDSVDPLPGAGDEPGAAPGDNGGGAPAIPPTPAPQDDAARIAEVTARLADRFFETSSSSGNSGNNAFVTGVQQMQLCEFGRFGRREETIFSGSTPTDFVDTSSEDIFLGTWSVKIIQGFTVLELNIDQSDEPINNPIRQILVEFTPDGRVAFDGSVATSEQDAAADCAAAQAGGGATGG